MAAGGPGPLRPGEMRVRTSKAGCPDNAVARGAKPPPSPSIGRPSSGAGFRAGHKRFPPGGLSSCGALPPLTDPMQRPAAALSVGSVSTETALHQPTSGRVSLCEQIWGWRRPQLGWRRPNLGGVRQNMDPVWPDLARVRPSSCGVAPNLGRFGVASTCNSSTCARVNCAGVRGASQTPATWPSCVRVRMACVLGRRPTAMRKLFAIRQGILPNDDSPTQLMWY